MSEKFFEGFVFPVNPSKDLTKEDQIRAWESSQKYLKLIQEFLDKQKKALVKATDEQSYECPNWALLKADRNGQLRAIEKLEKVLNLNFKNIGEK